MEELNHQPRHQPRPHQHQQQKSQCHSKQRKTSLPADVQDVVLERFFLKAGSTQKRVSPPSGHKDYNHARYRQDEKEGFYRDA